MNDGYILAFYLFVTKRSEREELRVFVLGVPYPQAVGIRRLITVLL